jgi:hypothetical protein
MNMLDRLDGLPVATLIQVTLTLLVALVGGVVTIVNPDALGFDEYVQLLVALSVGNGLLGVGRGLSNKSKLTTHEIEGVVGTREDPPPP